MTSFGLHASLLPAYRGGAPLIWAMIKGEERTGVTLFQMDDGVDTGPVFSARDISIDQGDEIGDLVRKAEEAALDILTVDFPAIASGELLGVPQADGHCPVMPQRSFLDGKIDWREPAAVVERFIRAQTKPYPGAFFQVQSNQIVVWKASIVEASRRQAKPGAIFFDAEQFYVKCKDGWLRLDDFETEDSPSKARNVIHGVSRRMPGR